MKAIEARKLAIEQNPELSRLYHVTKVEIKNAVSKGKFILKKTFEAANIGFAEIVAETLRKESFEVKILRETGILEIKW